MPSISVMWFRRDLRLSDNPALLEAVRASDEVVAAFVVDPVLWEPSGPPRRAFLAGCLRALDDSLDGRLVMRHGRPAEAVARLAAEVEAERVFAAEDFGPYGRHRDEAVAKQLAGEGRELVLVGSPYAVAPGEVLTNGGTPYRVFTPYHRAWAERGWAPPATAPRSRRWVDGVRSDGVPAAGADDPDGLPAPGEAAAKRAARRFFDDGLVRYDRDRNAPGVEGTSRLSPYLKWGCIHPRQLLAKLGRGKGADIFRKELCWREFYADVLFNDPESARRAWAPAMRTMEVDEGHQADERLAAWAEGRTGYPLVDAGMRQLRQEHWMHNRVRMTVASFLVKDLHLDWQRGARHFMRQLVDGDLASNNHGWQWVAGTGPNAPQYERVFNPVTQSKRFDPDGTYIKRYVPELADLDAKTVHEPWTAPGGPPNGYPAPIVDHAAERVEAIRRFEQRPETVSGERLDR